MGVWVCLWVCECVSVCMLPSPPARKCLSSILHHAPPLPPLDMTWCVRLHQSSTPPPPTTHPPHTHHQIEDVVTGKTDYADSPLSGAPHTMDMLMSEQWDRTYSRNTAAFPAPWQTNGSTTKFWPTVGRVDNVYGDRNLVCTCPPMDIYE